MPSSTGVAARDQPSEPGRRLVVLERRRVLPRDPAGRRGDPRARGRDEGLHQAARQGRDRPGSCRSEAWTILMTASPGILLGLGCLLVLGVGAMLIGFCVQHDANHGAYFRKRRYNHLLGWSARRVPRLQQLRVARQAQRRPPHVHERRRLRRRRHPGADRAALLPAQAPRPWYRLQHVYIWPLYSLMGLRCSSSATSAALVRGASGTAPSAPARLGPGRTRRRARWSSSPGRSSLPLLVYPWWLVARVRRLRDGAEPRDGGDVPARALRRGGELRPPRRSSETETRVWAVHEVESTVDFCPRNRVLTWMLGGLNYQIEHHLFPRVPTPTIRASRASCAGLRAPWRRYTAPPSLARALSSHAPPPARDGTAGMPVEIEMGS